MILVCSECKQRPTACDCPASIRNIKPLAPVTQISQARTAQLRAIHNNVVPLPPRPPKDAA